MKMKKSYLLDFIEKYYLSGTVEAAAWDISEDTLSTKIITEDKSLMGEVVVNKAGFTGIDTKIGILNSGLLSKFLSLMDDEFELDLQNINESGEEKYVSVQMRDKKQQLNYMLSDLLVIPKPKGLKDEPPYDLEIGLTKEFMNDYIKVKGVFSETKIATLLKNRDGEYKLVLGYSSINTNRAFLDVKVNEINSVDKTISYNADYIKEIFSANKGAKKAVFKISSEGLGFVAFEGDNYTAKYYIVEADTDFSN